jgi:hypothetical protein
MYQKLCCYVERYRSEGRTSCPLFSTDLAQAPPDVDPAVVAWVKEQRRQYRNLRERIGDTRSSPPPASDLDLERIIDLERIGFTWELNFANSREYTILVWFQPSMSGTKNLVYG